MRHAMIFAHAGEVHADSTAEAVHNIWLTLAQNAWIAVPVYLGLLGLLVFAMHRCRVKFPIIVLVLYAVLIISGIAASSVAPAISAAAIAIGLTMSLGLSLLSLASSA